LLSGLRAWCPRGLSPASKKPYQGLTELLEYLWHFLKPGDLTNDQMAILFGLLLPLDILLCFTYCLLYGLQY
jgi:hypothetical protein